MDYLQEMFADRIGGNRFGQDGILFKFEKIKNAKRIAAMENPNTELIDLGVGEPDTMADLGIVEKLNEHARQWINRGYADNGIIEFQSAAADYMNTVYGVTGLDPETEILHSMGSKAALAMIPQAFINQRDVTLMTTPGYPIIGTKTEWMGGHVYQLPLRSHNRYLPDFDSVPLEIRKRAKLLYINYPNNPTGATATSEFYKRVVEFAVQNQIIVVQDAAYAALTFGGKSPFSFLSVSGAKEVGVEVHSLSKAFSMTGWRLGFVAGNEKIIKAIAAVKDNNDSGQFKAIQKAGAYALRHPEITEDICKKYERRHKKLAKVLQKVGFHVNMPEATFYQYIQIPKGIKDGTEFESAEQFSEYLIKKALISTVPWDDQGHYVRLSITFVAENLQTENDVIDEIERRLQACNFIFE